MSTAAIDALSRHEQELIAALDAEDADAIVAASQAVSEALVRVRAASPRGPEARKAAEGALRLADAARVRVNVLADMTEARITRMAQATGAASAAPTYGRNARLVRR